MKLRALFSSHTWKLSFSFKKFFINWISIFAIIWTFVDFFNFFFSSDNQPWKPSVWIVFGIGILIALWRSHPRLTRKVRLKDQDVSIKLVVDNMFKRKGATVIIPVNTLFQHRDVDEGAIQIQYRNSFFDSANLFDRKLNDQLQDEPHQIVIYNNNQMRKYSAGTVVRLETPKKRIKAAYLVATAELNEHGRAVPDRLLKQTALVALWKHIAQRGRKESIVIPIIGSGRGRLNVTRYELIHDIVYSFLEAVKECKFTEELTIVIDPRAFIRHEYSLDEMEEYLRYVAKYAV